MTRMAPRWGCNYDGWGDLSSQAAKHLPRGNKRGRSVWSASNKQVMVVGAVARRASCRQRCSRRLHRAQTGCRRRRRSKTGTAPGVSARSSAARPHPASDRPPPLPGEPQSSGWGTEGRPGGRTAATLPDQTPHSLWADRWWGRKDTKLFQYGRDHCSIHVTAQSADLLQTRAMAIRNNLNWHFIPDQFYGKRDKDMKDIFRFWLCGQDKLLIVQMLATHPKPVEKKWQETLPSLSIHVSVAKFLGDSALQFVLAVLDNMISGGQTPAGYKMRVPYMTEVQIPSA